MNTASPVGRLSEQGVRLEYIPERAKPQLSFALTVMELGRDGIAQPTYIPCMVVSDNAERSAEVLEPHDLIATTAGTLQWKAGRTKESGKLRVVTFNVAILDMRAPALAGVAQDEQLASPDDPEQGDETPTRPEPKRKPRYPRWKPKPAASN